MTTSSHRDDHDGLVEFLIGLILGIVTGGVFAVLFAPRSGAETQQRVQRFVTHLPRQVQDDFQNPEGQTRRFIDKTRVNLENQWTKMNRAIRAGKMAEAKKREELASGGYELDS